MLKIIPLVICQLVHYIVEQSSVYCSLLSSSEFSAQSFVVSYIHILPDSDNSEKGQYTLIEHSQHNILQ